MRFIGREKETEDLMQVLSDDRQAAVLVYGRRRIGKSELIRHCLEQMNCRQVVFQCRQVTEAQNMQAFSEAIAYSLSMPGLSFLNLNDALKFLFAAAEKEKIIVVLDEYPFLRKQIEGCDSIIQAFLDAGLHTSKLKLILCGSYIDVMKSLLEYENPLYGRFSLVIKLNQMDYLVSSEFYQSYSNEDKVKMFSVFGGVPYYNSLIDTNLSADDNIIKLVLKENAPLQNEVDLYLRNEISKLENANSVFNAIAAGKTKFKDIYTASGLSTDASLNNMLTKLSEMEMITKEYPINKPNDKKKAVYRISDPLSDFYFRYIFRNPVRIQVMGPEVFFQRVVRKDFEEQYIPKQFEKICRQFLIRMNRAGKIDPPFEEIGKYYYDNPADNENGEFDIVTKDEKGWIFYEAKYRKKPVIDAMIAGEEQQVNKSPLHAYDFGFFSKSGFSLSEKHTEKLYTLEDMYQKI